MQRKKIRRFLTDQRVPFENNQEEGNIKTMKLQQKYQKISEPNKKRYVSAELEPAFLQSESTICRL
jgi:hypothetical protein